MVVWKDFQRWAYTRGENEQHAPLWPCSHTAVTEAPAPANWQIHDSPLRSYAFGRIPSEPSDPFAAHSARRAEGKVLARQV